MSDNIINSRSFTLDDFQRLAAQSEDQQELRLRKHGGDLTNTPLGFISRNFGDTHAQSNRAANQAFLRALGQDPRYQEIARTLIPSLERGLPQQEALTPARIKEALGIADRMLCARALCGHVTDLGLLPTDALRERFTAYALDYLSDHPEVSLPTLPYGDEGLLTEEQRALPAEERGRLIETADQKRAASAARLLRGFFRDEGTRIPENGFGFTAASLNGDQARADALNSLLLNCHELLQRTDQVTAAAFPERPGPAGSRFCGNCQDALHSQFKQITDLLREPGDEGPLALMRPSPAALGRLEQAIQGAGPGLGQRRDMLTAINRALSSFIRLAAPTGNDTEAALDRLCERLAGKLESAAGSPGALMRLAREAAIGEIAASGQLDGQGDLQPGLSRPALGSSAFASRALAALGEHPGDLDARALMETLRREAGSFL
ncbi:MAG: hypothetical protein K6A65_00025, partial [Succinivibrionaceae bacterium]|nr:hypothetical protein [Succinivibrionaceae bacterium]